MYVYSRNIVKFINDIKTEIRYILTREIGLRVNGDWFYDRQQESLYPIKIVIVNTGCNLGYFNSDFLELGFHESLMRASRQQLQNLIRHELAHYITFINHGIYVQHHGPEFKAFCQRMGWGSEVSSATATLDVEIQTSDSEENSVLRKVQKLMSLATSSNQHEAEQAVIKSQQLLLKHNIESKYIDGGDDEKVYLKRLMKQPKQNAKMTSIGNILQTFFVSIVYARRGHFSYIEVMGTITNIGIAEYVADVLNIEFDNLWDQARREHAGLKGMVAKNSFFRGIARGYCNKINDLKRGYSGEVSYALMVLEKKLIDAQAMAYKRLTSSRSSAGYCQKSSALGEKMGRQLNINPALKSAAKRQGLLIGHSG